MDSLHKLEEIFAKFPGIGPRQAKRFVYYLLNKPASSIDEFTRLIAEVRKSTAECPECHRFFVRDAGPSAKGMLPCPICSDSNRDGSTLMIVARDSDLETVEKSSAYHGLYFVLGGTVPVLDQDPSKRIRLKSLLERASRTDLNASLKEVILSLNTTPDGEHTADIVRDALSKVIGKNVKVTILGRGLSTGAELEYADSETIKNALKNRE